MNETKDVSIQAPATKGSRRAEGYALGRSARTLCVAAAILCGIGVARASDPQWTLSSDDTRLNLTVSGNKIYIASLLNPTQNWNWVPVLSEVPMLAAIGGQTPNWTYQDAAVDSTLGTKVTLRFTSTTPNLELKSIWWARPGVGPVEYWSTVENKSGGDLVCQQNNVVSADLNVKADTTVTLTRFNRASDLRTGWSGILQSTFTVNQTLASTTYNVDDCGVTLPALLPFHALGAGSGHGLYLGYEWSFGRFLESTGADPLAIRFQAWLWDSKSFTLSAGKFLKIPALYIGAYQGDLDTAGNALKRWYWNYKMPQTMRDHANEPLLEYCVPGNESGLNNYFASYNMTNWGGELAKIDIDWLSQADGWFGSDIAKWNPNPANWPNGMTGGAITHANGQKLALYMSQTYQWVDLGTQAGRDLEKAALSSRYASGWFDYYRSDFWCENNARGGLGPAPFQGGSLYLSHEGFMEVLDYMINAFPNFRYEHCDAGGTLKDFDSLRRITVMTTEDSATPDKHRQAMYTSLYAINAVQLKADVAISGGPGSDSDPAWVKYCLATGFMGANMASSWGAFTAVMAAQAQIYWPLYTGRMRPILRGADVHHILPICDGVNWDGMQYFNTPLKKGAVLLFKPSNAASDGDAKAIKLKGLVKDLLYTLTFQDRTNLNCLMTGADLMNTGVMVTGMTGNYASEIIWIDEVKVHVTPSVDPVAGIAPLSVNFSATGISSKGNSLTYAWTFGDGGTSGTQNPTHTYTNAGYYVAQVTADDGEGNVATGQVAVTAMGGTRRMFIGWDGYSKSGTLTNFPALVVLGTNLADKGFAYGQVASSNGWDLMFTDSEMTMPLNHEIERWDTNGLSHVWVQVPRLAQGGGIWAFWGSTNMANAPAPCMTNGAVWSEGYVGVWHMTNGVNLSSADSTANRNNGTVGAHATATSGLIDGGGLFDADINACINVGALNPLPDGTGTASVWINWNATGGNGWAMAKGADYDSGNSWGIAVLPGVSQCNVCLYYDVSGAAYPTTATIASGTGVWHHVTAVMSPNAQYLYVDGALRVTRNRATLTPNAGNGFNIGKTDRASPYHYAFFGALDEARVATAQRSADWVWAEYQTMASNMTFATYGTVSLVGDSNLAPTVATPAQANPSPVTGTTAELTALGADDIGESVLKYTWSATGTPPASVSFVPNGNNAAKNATATFGKAGSYSLQVVIRDPYGATTTSSVAVVVNQTLTSIAVVPVSALVQTNLTRQFATTGFDQFGRTMDAQPGFAWGVSGGGTISAGGLFKAGALAGGPYTVTASAGGKTGEATVVVSDLPSVVPTKMLVRFAGYTNRTEVLTNFPVLVVFSNNVGGSGFSYSNFLSSSGHDLRFVGNLTDATSLNYEIESWNTNAGQCSYVWVRVPTIPANGSGHIWAKWGNSADANQLPCTTNGAVWTNGYVGVWHMTNGVNLSGADSTANRNNGTVGSGAAATGGLIDGGGEFHGTFNDYVGLGTLNPLPNGTGTASVWAKWTADALAKNNYVLAKGNDNGPVSWGFDLIPSDTSCSLYLLYGSGQWVGPAAIQSVPGIWHLVTAVMRPGAQELYVDGVLALTGAKATITPAAGEGFFIGKTSRATPYAYPANGTLDEVRVATAQRSADWIWAEWMSVASNAVFAQCGKVRESGTDYEQWQTQYFTESELTDENVSGDAADPDDDKMSNLQEFYARTGPRDQSSFLKIDSAQTVTEGSGGFVVRWSSAAGVFYRLTRATNLADWVPDWVVENIESTPTENVYTDAVPPNPSAFYRIEVQKAQ